MSEISAPVTSQLNIRASEEDRDRWKRAAERRGITVSDFIRDGANRLAREILDCPHPEEAVRRYPWSAVCLKCGERLK